MVSIRGRTSTTQDCCGQGLAGRHVSNSDINFLFRTTPSLKIPNSKHEYANKFLNLENKNSRTRIPAFRGETDILNIQTSFVDPNINVMRIPGNLKYIFDTNDISISDLSLALQEYCLV